MFGRLDVWTFGRLDVWMFLESYWKKVIIISNPDNVEDLSAVK
jgi:hypothetical protein